MSIKRSDVLGIAIAVIVCELVGIVGAVFTAPAIPTWYASLVKPSFTPPGWLFGPVWTTLYALMGIAAFIVWRRGLAVAGVKAALLLFVVQLLLNALWSPVFFGVHSPSGGLAIILALWVAIVATIALSAGVSKAAAVLLVPYLLWVSFATVLNFSIWRLN